jgi:flagellar hook-associated protein 3 FlgL
MRVTSTQVYDGMVANLQRRQQQLTQAQSRLTSGKRVQQASDDPAAAAVAERARAALARHQGQQRALEASRSAMQLSESALGQAGDLMLQVRDQILAAGNGSYSDSERRILGDSIRGLRRDLLAVANRDDGSGGALFGGQGAAGAPFVEAAGGVGGVGGVQWRGAAGQAQAHADGSMPLSLDGQAVWLQAPLASSPGSSVSVFDVLDRVANELLTPGRSSAAVAAGVQQALEEVDSVTQNLSRWRAYTGESLRRADEQASRLAQATLEAQSTRSQAEDVDMVQAISDYQAQQNGYEALLKTYASMQRVSLFQYLG